VRGLEGLPPEILLVSLPGHTLGHAGVAIDRGGHWLLHAGDAYFFYAEMDPTDPYCIPGLRWYQRMMDKDHALRVSNQARLRELRRGHGAEVQIFCAHDEVEFERLANHSSRESAAAPRISRIEQLVPHEYARKSEPPPGFAGRLFGSAPHRSVAR
jgi:glyoxylase-like metal-dependent hydrolase (beta-lactamase superfamily II)